VLLDRFALSLQPVGQRLLGGHFGRFRGVGFRRARPFRGARLVGRRLGRRARRVGRLLLSSALASFLGLFQGALARVVRLLCGALAGRCALRRGDHRARLGLGRLALVVGRLLSGSLDPAPLGLFKRGGRLGAVGLGLDPAGLALFGGGGLGRRRAQGRVVGLFLGGGLGRDALLLGRVGGGQAARLGVGGFLGGGLDGSRPLALGRVSRVGRPPFSGRHRLARLGRARFVLGERARDRRAFRLERGLHLRLVDGHDESVERVHAGVGRVAGEGGGVGCGRGSAAGAAASRREQRRHPRQRAVLAPGRQVDDRARGAERFEDGGRASLAERLGRQRDRERRAKAAPARGPDGGDGGAMFVDRFGGGEGDGERAAFEGGRLFVREFDVEPVPREVFQHRQLGHVGFGLVAVPQVGGGGGLKEGGGGVVGVAWGGGLDSRRRRGDSPAAEAAINASR
jgi:hypothetical protein